MFTVQEFWNNIDQINPYRSLGELVRASGIDYHRLTQQRSRGYMPKPEDLLKLSQATRRSIESLLTGATTRSFYPKRIERIADCCMYRATEEDLLLIERVLRIPSSETGEKKDDRTSGSALA